MELTSGNNTYIKYIASLKDARTRRQERKYVIEGQVMLDAAVATGLIPESIVCTTAAQAREYGASRRYTVAESTFQKISDTVTPQGVLGVFSEPENTLIPPVGHTFVLDNIRDPGNLGTIIRTAAALGVKYLYLLDCVDVYNSKVLRATMSGIFHVQCITCGISDIERLVKPVCELVVADMRGENLFSVEKFDRPLAIVVGNEAHGVSRELTLSADRILALPMKNIESLNAAVSISIIAYYFLNK